MVHVPAKFRENTSMRFRVIMRIGFLKKCVYTPPPGKKKKMRTPIFLNVGNSIKREENMKY